MDYQKYNGDEVPLKTKTKTSNPYGQCLNHMLNPDVFRQVQSKGPETRLARLKRGTKLSGCPRFCHAMQSYEDHRACGGFNKIGVPPARWMIFGKIPSFEMDDN